MKMITANEAEAEGLISCSLLREMELLGKISPIKKTFFKKKYLESEIKFLLHQRDIICTGDYEFQRTWERENAYLKLKTDIERYRYSSVYAGDYFNECVMRGAGEILDSIGGFKNWSNDNQINDKLGPVYNWYISNYETWMLGSLYQFSISCLIKSEISVPSNLTEGFESLWRKAGFEKEPSRMEISEIACMLTGACRYLWYPYRLAPTSQDEVMSRLSTDFHNTLSEIRKFHME